MTFVMISMTNTNYSFSPNFITFGLSMMSVRVAEESPNEMKKYIGMKIEDSESLLVKERDDRKNS
jgi:hypothetical protein